MTTANRRILCLQVIDELNTAAHGDAATEIVWDARTLDMWQLVIVYVLRQMKHGYEQEVEQTGQNAHIHSTNGTPSRM